MVLIRHTRRGRTALVALALITAATTAQQLQAVPAAFAAPAEALLVGDSVLNGLAQSYGAAGRNALAARHSFVLDAAGCRRLITTSCHIGNGPTPTDGITVVRSRAGQYDGSLVIAAGYDDPSSGTSGIGAAVDTMVTEARRQGITRVIWLTYREAGTAGNLARFRASNAVLRAKLAVYPELQLADWAAASAPMPASWFSADGIHLGVQSVNAMAQLIGDALDVPHAQSRCAAASWVGVDPPSAAAAADTAPPGGLHVLDSPARLVDTRSLAGKVGAGRMIAVPVAGTHGVPADAAAAVVTVTAVNPCAPAFLTVFPCGGGVPTTSVLNALAQSIVANSAIVRLGEGGICVYASQPTDIVVDLSGWIGIDGAATTPTTPTRLVDTRPGQTEALAVAQQRLRAGQLLPVNIADDPNDPDAASVAAVTVNLTSVAPAANGYLTVLPGPCIAGAFAGAGPATSNLNVSAGHDAAAAATVGVVGGQICVYSSTDTDIVVDLQALHSAAAAPAAAATTAISPQRLADSRVTGRVAAGVALALDLDATPGGAPTSLTGVVLNVTAVGATGNGFIAVYACALPSRPVVSSVNFASGATVANRAVVSTAGGRSVCVYSNVDTDVVVDVEAWIG